MLVVWGTTLSKRVPNEGQRKRRSPDSHSMERMETRELPRTQPPAVEIMDAAQRQRRQRERQGRRKRRKRKRPSKCVRANMGTAAWASAMARRPLGHMGRRLVQRDLPASRKRHCERPQLRRGSQGGPLSNIARLAADIKEDISQEPASNRQHQGEEHVQRPQVHRRRRR